MSSLLKTLKQLKAGKNKRDDMIWRVATAIADDADKNKRVFIDPYQAAMAAIKAMRIPTDEMLETLSGQQRRETKRRAIGHDYTTMIDLILQGKENET